MGFGAHSRLHTFKIERLSLDLPLVIEIVDTRAKLEAFLADIDPLIHEGLATLEAAEVRYRPSRERPCLVPPRLGASASASRAHEVEAWGANLSRPQQNFAMYASPESPWRWPCGVWCKSGPGNQAFMVQTAPERFFVPPYVGPSGWIGVYLDTGTNWGELAELLEDAWRLTVPKRLLRGLETRKGGRC
jgi:hypothetical protein